MTVELAVMGAGVLAIAGAWRVVASGTASVWLAMTATLVGVGIAALAVRSPVLAPRVDVGAAAAVGVASGVALFGATRGFVAAAAGWARLRRDTGEAYGRASEVTPFVGLALSLVSVAGEELFWRGLFQPRLAEIGRLSGAVLTWAAFVLANLPSASLPIVLGAVVGGALWAALAFWSGGLLASLACHSTWTAAMLLWPPRAREVAS